MGNVSYPPDKALGPNCLSHSNLNGVRNMVFSFGIYFSIF